MDKRDDITQVFKYFEEQSEGPALIIKENLEFKHVLEEIEKSKQTNHSLFTDPQVLKRFLEQKNSFTLFLSKNGKKRIWKATKLPKKVLDIAIQENNNNKGK